MIFKYCLIKASSISVFEIFIRKNRRGDGESGFDEQQNLHESARLQLPLDRNALTNAQIQRGLLTCGSRDQKFFYSKSTFTHASKSG